MGNENILLIRTLAYSLIGSHDMRVSALFSYGVPMHVSMQPTSLLTRSEPSPAEEDKFCDHMLALLPGYENHIFEDIPLLPSVSFKGTHLYFPVIYVDETFLFRKYTTM